MKFFLLQVPWPTMWLWRCLPFGLMQLKSGLPRQTHSLRSKLWLSQKTKFYHTVAVLPQEVAAQILDLIRAPPAQTPYEVLKNRLITLYSLNDYWRFQALVSLPLSGDQKPSRLMNMMLVLLPDDYKPDFILWGLFLRRLPTEVWSHLLQEKISDPRAFALKADELF